MKDQQQTSGTMSDAEWEQNRDEKINKGVSTPSTYSSDSSRPYRCPICNGNGIVPEGFYNQIGGTWLSSGTGTEDCRACKGTGIVWK